MTRICHCDIIISRDVLEIITVPQWFGDSLESGVATGVSINRVSVDQASQCEGAVAWGGGSDVARLWWS